MYRNFQRDDSVSEQAPHYAPDETAAAALLQYMTKEQLENFLNKPEVLEQHIADLEQVKKVQRDRENIIVKNKSLAEYNISQQPTFEALKREVATSYEEVNRHKMALGQDIAKLDSLPGSQSHDTMLAIFQTEAATADEKSEELAEQFCDGSVDIDTFMSDYVQQRTNSYMMRAKLEKLGDLFRQGSTSTSSAPYPSNSYPQKPVTHTPNTGYGGAGYGTPNAPYPSNPYGAMPMPGYYQR